MAYLKNLELSIMLSRVILRAINDIKPIIIMEVTQYCEYFPISNLVNNRAEVRAMDDNLRQN